MERKYIIGIIILVLSLFLFTSCNDKTDSLTDASLKNLQTVDKKPKTNANTPVVFASGLNNPRGLKFGPDGYLYVAEGGEGGTDSTVGQCDQVVPPIGPYKGGYTSRISKISMNGIRTTVADNLPSSQTSAQTGGLTSGVADIAFINGVLYGIESGAGCSHGLAGTDNVIFRVNPNGTTTTIANLSEYQRTHPVANPEEDDFEPDGTWYSMISLRGDLYAVEPNHGELVKVTLNGSVSRVVDVSASQGHIVPTALAYHGNFYIGNLNTFPVNPGSSSIFKVTPSGQIKKDEAGFTTVLGIAFDNRDRMYVLEMSTAAGDPAPFTGKIIRVSPSGAQEEIVTGLFFPTGMAFGPDGSLYISNKGFGLPPGSGEILKVQFD